jgi:hypothetical protein
MGTAFWEGIMLRLVRSTFFALFFVSVGFAASFTDGPSAHAQPAARPDQPRSAPSLPAAGGNTERPGAAVLKAAAAAPEIGAVVEEMKKKKIEGMERNLNQLVSEARATAARYVLWGAVAMVALMFISSVIGGTVVGLMMRRAKAG